MESSENNMLIFLDCPKKIHGALFARSKKSPIKKKFNAFR